MTLNEAIIRRGLTPDTLAAAMDVPRETVIGWLCHRRRIHRGKYARLQQVLGLSGQDMIELLPDLRRKI